MSFGDQKTGGRPNIRNKIISIAGCLCVFSFPCFGEEDSGADVLFGLASIVSATSPAVTAGIQASADKAIAGINAKSSIAMSQIQSDTSKYQAASNERISMMQNMTAQQINGENNRAQTERLGMMLSEQAAARNQAFGLQQEERRYEYSLKRQQLQMAEIQRDLNYKLAVMQMQTEKIKAGLSTGFTRVATGLSVTPGGTSLASRPKSVGSQVLGAVGGRGRILSMRRGWRVADRISGFGFEGQGSTRSVRQRGVSDLSSFQSSLAPARSVMADQGFRRHSLKDDSSADYSRPSHR